VSAALSASVTLAEEETARAGLWPHRGTGLVVIELVPRRFTVSVFGSAAALRQLAAAAGEAADQAEPPSG
jgi:hypothetical protein